MAIDIKNINEITFTQSFRGYNTEEVDDFLDDLYEEASQNNREIDELRKKLKALESGEGGGMDQEEAYAVIANAQEEADKIVEAARQKAHTMIERAESQINENAAVPAPAAAPTAAGVDTASLNKLKDVLRETYEKQMAAINAIAGAKPEPEIKQPEKKSEIPSVSFSGITKQFPQKIPAERDILSEINAIGLDSPKASEKESDIAEEPAPESTISLSTPDVNESPEPESGGLAFSFAEHEEPADEKPETIEPQKQSESEDPDDIIAQILRDNNRN